MQHVDVLIVGGGPAGSSCAWSLRASGLDVAVMDRREFPRDKTCAGWITPPVLNLLQIDADEYADGRTMQPITGFRTGLLGAAQVETHYGQLVSYGIRRCEFDHYLLNRCAARLLTGQPVQVIERKGDRWVVNGEISARMLVGAGGHFCPVARLTGFPDQSGSPLVAAQEIEFEVSEAELARGTVDAQTPELLFCPDLNGYGWCFRKGNFLNIGLGHTDSHRLKQDIRDLRRILQDQGKVCCEIPMRLHGHAYRLYDGARRPLLQEGVLLVGDSAGLADARSGEGIRPAIESGIMAGRTIALCHGDFRALKLEPYERWILKRFGEPRGMGRPGTLAAMLRHLMARALLRSRRFTRQILLDRWFLHRESANSPILSPM